LRATGGRRAFLLASLPDKIRGYGPVKAPTVAQAKLREAELLEALRRPSGTRQRAA
jgi:indolepyruvate ferredoxin oxidoreductase